MKKQVQKMSFLLINLSVQQHRIRKRSSPNKNKLEKVEQLSEYCLLQTHTQNQEGN